MKYIYLRSSDLAKLTGHNKYETLEKTVNQILTKNGIQYRYVPKSNIEEGLTKLTEDQLSALKLELNLPNESSLSQIETVIKSTVMGNSYSGKLTEEESKERVDSKLDNKPILQSLELGIKQDLRMKRGNIKENSNLDQIQKKKGIQIQQRNSKMYTKELYRGDKYCLIVRGKVDGLLDGISGGGTSGGGTVVETKNRTKYLFNELRGYERVQLEAYMFLTGFKNALLTEHYNNESNCIEYTHDEEFWSSCVQSMIEFIDTHIKPYLQ